MEEIDELAAHMKNVVLSSKGASSRFKGEMDQRVLPMLRKVLDDVYEAQPADPIRDLAERLSTTNLQSAKFVQQHVLALKEGEFFGEIALLTEKPRQATVKASAKTTCMVIARDAFTRLCGNLVEILKRNMERYQTIEGIAKIETEVIQTPVHTVLPTEPEPDVEPEPVPKSFRGRASLRRPCVFVEPVNIEEDWQPPKYTKNLIEEERLHKLLASTALLGHLEIAVENLVVDALAEKKVTAGTEIITQGDQADYFYVLDEGECDVFKAPEGGGEPVKVFEYSTGGSFGELALLHGEPRAASVRARTDCKLWLLDRDTFRKIMVTAGQRSMQNRTKFLDNVSLLSDLQQFEKFKIAEAMEMRTFNEGDTIIREGEDGKEFFIIHEGAVDCYKTVLKF